MKEWVWPWALPLLGVSVLLLAVPAATDSSPSLSRMHWTLPCRVRPSMALLGGLAAPSYNETREAEPDVAFGLIL